MTAPTLYNTHNLLEVVARTNYRDGHPLCYYCGAVARTLLTGFPGWLCLECAALWCGNDKQRAHVEYLQQLLKTEGSQSAAANTKEQHHA